MGRKAQPPRLCSIEGCARPVRGHGWCNTHYQRWRHHGDPLIAKFTRTPQPIKRCTVAGCDRATLARGYCSLHYQRLQSHGSTEAFTHWPPAKRDALEVLVESGWSDAKIAKKLGIGESTAKKARIRFGLPFPYRVHHTANQVAALMGVDVVNVIRWIQHGYLAGRKTGARYGRFLVWQITEAALLAFIENPARWCCYDPCAITEPLLREHAIEIRGDVRFLTPKDLAWRLGVSRMTVLYALNNRRIPGDRDGWLWYVRESDVELARTAIFRVCPSGRWESLDIADAPPTWRAVRVRRRAA